MYVPVQKLAGLRPGKSQHFYLSPKTEKGQCCSSNSQAEGILFSSNASFRSSTEVRGLIWEELTFIYQFKY